MAKPPVATTTKNLFDMQQAALSLVLRVLSLRYSPLGPRFAVSTRYFLSATLKAQRSPTTTQNMVGPEKSRLSRHGTIREPRKPTGGRRRWRAVGPYSRRAGRRAYTDGLCVYVRATARVVGRAAVGTYLLLRAYIPRVAHARCEVCAFRAGDGRRVLTLCARPRAWRRACLRGSSRVCTFSDRGRDGPGGS